MEILKQAQYSPMRVEEQVAIIACGTNDWLRDVPVNKILDAEKEFLEFLNLKHKDVLMQIKQGNMNDEILGVLHQVMEDISRKYVK